MKRIVCVFLLTVFLAACAGNPPAWWNPDNRYGASANAVSATAVRSVRKTVVKEETIDVADTSYEEETIDPLPQEEEISAQAAGEETLPAPSVLE